MNNDIFKADRASFIAPNHALIVWTELIRHLLMLTDFDLDFNLISGYSSDPVNTLFRLSFLLNLFVHVSRLAAKYYYISRIQNKRKKESE